MRCIACDEALTDKEATRKFLHSGTYTQMCNKCLDTIRDAAPTEDDDVRLAPSDFSTNDGEHDEVSESYD